MSKPTLSVIVPNYNDADFISIALAAICEQSFPPTEVIVIDNCSTDNSIAVIKETAAKYPVIRLIQNEKNGGFVYSVNKAAKLVSGDYLYIASANDLNYPGFFEKSMEMLAQYPNAGLCCTDFDIVDIVNNTTLRSTWMPNAGYYTPAQLAEMARVNSTTFSAGPNSILRRDKLPPDPIYVPEIEYFGDWSLSKLIAFRYGCCYIPESLVARRWQDNSLSESAAKDKVYYQKVCSNVFSLYASPDYEDIAPVIIRSRSLRNIELAMRTPVALFASIYGANKLSRYANALFFHLTSEYFASIFEPLSSKCRPVVQSIHDIFVSGFHVVKNQADRCYAKFFHEYARTKSAVRRQLGL